MPINEGKIRWLQLEEEAIIKTLKEVRGILKDEKDLKARQKLEESLNDKLKKAHDINILIQLEYFKSDYN